MASRARSIWPFRILRYSRAVAMLHRYKFPPVGWFPDPSPSPHSPSGRPGRLTASPISNSIGSTRGISWAHGSDDNTTFAEDEKGVPICYDWLRVGDAPPVRVQVKKSYVEKEWGLMWKTDADVAQRFDAAKRHHVDAALGAKLLPGSDYRVYTIE